MSGHWSRLECELIFEDYLDMLTKEARLESFNKTEHRRALKMQLPGRSDGAIEFKHQNISAVLIRAGHVYVRGYKPAWNYQDLLETVVLDRLSSAASDIVEIENAIIRQAAQKPSIEDTLAFLVKPPDRVPREQGPGTLQRTPTKTNFADRERRNRLLGQSGEAFVLEFERRRLEENGRSDLVSDVEWTSEKEGDGTGYDIRSFRDNTDEPLYVEVKTTNSGKYQPFMISSNEVSFSAEYSKNFSLYRVFEFSCGPKMYVLDGAVANHVDLSPTIYRASF